MIDQPQPQGAERHDAGSHRCASCGFVHRLDGRWDRCADAVFRAAYYGLDFDGSPIVDDDHRPIYNDHHKTSDGVRPRTGAGKLPFGIPIGCTGCGAASCAYYPDLNAHIRRDNVDDGSP